jgi:hypothetical protein
MKILARVTDLRLLIAAAKINSHLNQFGYLSSMASFDRFKFYSGQHISIEYDLS